MVGIYAITNIVNGKRYIGSSNDSDDRRQHHFAKLQRGIHPNRHLQAAYNLYGHDAFTFTVLQLCEEDALLSWEQAYLDEWKPEYNLNPIASKPPSNVGRRGFKMPPRSDEWRRKQAEAHMGKSQSEESNRKRSETEKGRPKSAETRAKMSLAQTGNKKGLGNKGHLGQSLSSETRAKMSEAHKQSPRAQAQLHKLHETNKKEH
jgi:group I intron endonuclease